MLPYSNIGGVFLKQEDIFEEEYDNLETYAALGAELVHEARTRGLLPRDMAETYFQKVEEAALAEYGLKDSDLDYKDLEVEIGGIDSIEDHHIMPPAKREEKMNQLVDYLESEKIEDENVEGVIASRPSGIGPASIIADRYEVPLSVEVFHGYGDKEEVVPEDAENVESVNYLGKMGHTEFFGENYDTEGKIILGGDVPGRDAGEADVSIDAPAAEDMQRRLLDENLNMSFRKRITNLLSKK